MAGTNKQTQKPYLSTQEILLFSDRVIYDYAIQFAERHRAAKVSAKQLGGLQNVLGAGSWDEILCYISNRLSRKTTTPPVKKFYEDLKGSLDELYTLAVEPGPYLLAKEFIQHLIVEYNYQRSLSNASDG